MHQEHPRRKGGRVAPFRAEDLPAIQMDLEVEELIFAFTFTSGYFEDHNQFVC